MMIKLWSLVILYLMGVSFSQFVLPWGLYQYRSQNGRLKNRKKDWLSISHPLRQQIISIHDKESKLVYNEGNKIGIQFPSTATISISTQGEYMKMEAKLISQKVQSRQKQLIITLSNLNSDDFDDGFSKNCKPSTNENQFKCILPFTFETIDGNKNEMQNRNMTQFMVKHGIPSKYSEITTVAISELMSSVCVYNRQEGIKHFGFCDKSGYNVKLSALAIDVLADFDFALAKTIFISFIDYLETELIYKNHHEGDCLPFPQHIQVFHRFYQFGSEQQEPIESLLKNYFIIPMLNKISTLEEEVNYREGKKLHPYLVQMLTQKWNKATSTQGLKSIYKESFTEDFKYHEYGFTLFSTPSKSAWIYKAIQEYAAIEFFKVKDKMSMTDIQEEYQELFTLVNIMKTYIGDEQNAKKGNYLSIVLSPNKELRLYSKFVGYDSLLPYVYKVGVIPKTSFVQLESQFGLKSSNIESYDEKYRYRGDIHAYFNYVILKGMKERITKEMKEMKETKNTSQRKEYDETLLLIKRMAQSVKKGVLKGYTEDNKIYTSWTPSGQGKEEISWLKIISVLLLSDDL